MNPDKDQDALAIEDEDMIDEDSENSDDDEKENEREEDSDTESEDENNDENDKMEDAAIEELKKKLSIAMGENSEKEEDSEDDDMTDEQMFAMDNAIAGAFKSMGKAQRQEKAKIETQKMNFKLRLLDVIEIYMKRNSTSPDQFIFVKPLLKLAKSKTENNLSGKAGRMVSKVMPGEKVSA